MLGLLSTVVVMAPNLAMAQVQDQRVDGDLKLIERRFNGLVLLLEDDSWELREQSTRMIGDANEGFELDMLAPILERGDLSVESRTRLRRAARDLFARTPKAGLGVGFGAMRDGGIEIGTVVPDIERFPAAGLLMPGDLILGTRGQSLDSSEELRSQIISYGPGELLNVQIIRNGETLDLDLPLGSYDFLTGAAPIIPSIADRAIAIRWARQGIFMPDERESGSQIDIDAWLEAGFPEQPAGAFRASNARRAPTIVSSGSSRDVFVGVGTLVRGRIEPWSNRTNAEIAMDQARRIELARKREITKLRVRMLSNVMKLSEEITGANPGDADAQEKLKKVQAELKSAQDELESINRDLDSIEPDPE